MTDPKKPSKTAGQKMTREERAALVAQMLANKKGGAKPAAGKTASFDWAALPEIKKAALQKKVAQSVGLGNPYMRHTADSGAALVEIDGRPTVNFCSYDYISVGEHPDVRAAAHAAVDYYGT
ncbi:MAG: 8-amino-7-oxononanoate synthase, partial [Pseudomonadota bacterium]